MGKPIPAHYRILLFKVSKTTQLFWSQNFKLSIKCGGRLLVIDGGFSKAFHQKTGIAGYTLVCNSRGNSRKPYRKGYPFLGLC